MKNLQDRSTAYLLAVIAWWCWVAIKINEALIRIYTAALRRIERRREK